MSLGTTLLSQVFCSWNWWQKKKNQAKRQAIHARMQNNTDGLLGLWQTRMDYSSRTAQLGPCGPFQRAIFLGGDVPHEKRKSLKCHKSTGLEGATQRYSLWIRLKIVRIRVAHQFTVFFTRSYIARKSSLDILNIPLYLFVNDLVSTQPYVKIVCMLLLIVVSIQVPFHNVSQGLELFDSLGPGVDVYRPRQFGWWWLQLLVRSTHWPEIPAEV